MIDLGPAAERMKGLITGVPDDAPLLDRVIGLTGRDPAWSRSGH